MHYIIYGFLLTVATLIFAGVPKIIRNLRYSRELALAPIEIDNMGGVIDAEYFRKADASLRRLGFSRNKDFMVSGIIGNAYCRNYRDNDGTMALAAQIVAPGGESARSVEFCAVFENGGELVVQHGQFAPVVMMRPDKEIHVFPGMADHEKLLAKFREKLRSRVSRGDSIKRIPASGVLDYARDDYAKDMRWYVERGYIRLDEKTDQYVPTVKMGLAGVTNFLNPFVDNFTWGRFIKGFGAALALALGAPFLLGAGVVPHGFSLGLFSAYQEEFLALGAAYLACGSIIGAVFERKSFIWAFLAIAPSIALFEGWVITHPLILTFITFDAAYGAGEFRAFGIRRGEGLTRFSAAMVSTALLFAYGLYPMEMWYALIDLFMYTSGGLSYIWAAL